jgi:GrpB-like predicted nucleotidyltransferase (UPF0157 family)
MTSASDDVQTTELIGGVEQRELVLVPYDADWVGQYETERRRIAAALGPNALQIEHIGSTAVPGLAAKPIIDVLVTVASIASEAEYLQALVNAGYQLRTREPGHRLFRTPDLGVHVHVLQQDDDAAAAYLDLRDRLRASETARQRYTAVKQRVIATGVTDMNAYSDAKADVIAAIRAEAISTRGND